MNVYHAQKIIKNSINQLVKSLKNKLDKTYMTYENYFGLKELKNFQNSVLNAEKVFIDSSKIRREVQTDIINLQNNLKKLRQKLDTTNRADENYLVLITEEHKLIKKEIILIENLRNAEEDEREKFSYFSNRLRESQDFERLRQEKIKYISLIGSIIGALLGILATSINYSIRQKDLTNLTKTLNDHVNLSNEVKSYNTEIKKVVDKLEQKNLNKINYKEDLSNQILKLNNQLDKLECENFLKTNQKLDFVLIGITLLNLSIIYFISKS